MQKPVTEQARVSVDMTPLIDIVFILLLFFLVTATFVRETGIRVNRPAATSAQPLSSDALRVTLTKSGALYMDGRKLTAGQLEQKVRAASLSDPRTLVVIVPDEDAASGRLVKVMDIARLAGAHDVAIATRESQP